MDHGRLQLALDAGRMGIWEWRIPDNKVQWSEGLERIHGLTPGGFDGTYEMYQRHLHPEDRDRVAAALRANLAVGREHATCHRIIRADGAVRWVESHARFVLDAHGKPERLIGVTRDITDEYQARTAQERARVADAARSEAERSHERLVEIFDAIPDAFAVYDHELRVVLCNRAAAKLLGGEPSVILGKRPWELVAGARESAVVQAYQRVLRTRQPETVVEYANALDRWFEASVFPLSFGVSAFSRDITERKRAEELSARLARHVALRADVGAAFADVSELRASEQRVCEALVKHLDVAFARLWTLDDSGTTLLLQASAGMYTHTDGPHSQVPVGKLEIGSIALEGKPHLTNDVRHDPRIGDPAWAAREKMRAFAGYPLIVDGKLVGVLAMFGRQKLHEDTFAVLGTISDLVAQGIVRRRTELELEQRVQELARSNADLEQFAYVASHDLQEPLRMVSSYTQLLARRYQGRLGQDADDFIGFAVEGVTRMQSLINDLLAYSRVGTRGRELAEVDLEKVFATALLNLQASIAEASAEITHDPLPKARGDEGQLVQVFQNLISNAIKFRAAAPPRVHVDARRDGQRWIVSVSDNGIGIEPQYFERIFVIFQRLHPREKYPGTGIGLAITKKIIERHGGKIWVESAPGRGSTIHFTLAARTWRVP